MPTSSAPSKPPLPEVRNKPSDLGESAERIAASVERLCDTLATLCTTMRTLHDAEVARLTAALQAKSANQDKTMRHWVQVVLHYARDVRTLKQRLLIAIVGLAIAAAIAAGVHFGR